MFKDLLPIGSVVILKGGLKKLMIVGMKISTEEAPDRFYDYIGVLFPEGFIGEKSCFLFDHSEINDVVFLGYSNPEREAFITEIDKEYEKSQMAEAE